jgi:hypothetical protein
MTKFKIMTHPSHTISSCRAPTAATASGNKIIAIVRIIRIIRIKDPATYPNNQILQGADGYHRKWQGFGQVYTGPVKAGNYGSKDFLQTQDLTTGETEYFRFQFL